MERLISTGQIWEMTTRLHMPCMDDRQFIELVPGDRFVIIGYEYPVFGSDTYQWIHCCYWGMEFRLRPHDFNIWAREITY